MNLKPYWLAALHLPHIGPRRLLRWLVAFRDIKHFFEASSFDLAAAGVDRKFIPFILQPNWQQVEKDLHWERNENHHIITFSDLSYPVLLKEIPDPPLILYIKGNIETLKGISLAIVGSRHATPAGVNNAEQFAALLARTGLVITSGMAIGVDAASHRGALSSQGLTIAVAGTGLNHTYPPRHLRLSQDIINHNGAIISEFPLDTPPYNANFPRRNRIICGLSIGVLVVEAALKSGTLITARLAIEQGREVFAIPGSIHQPQARGCHYLIREGATLVETADHILQELTPHLSFHPHSTKRPTPTLEQPPPPNLKQTPPVHGIQASPEPPHQSTLNHIDYEKTSIDVILLRTGLTASEVSSILLTLELDGYIQSVSGGYLRVSPKP